MDKITSIKVDDIKTKIDKQDIYIYNGFMAISKYIKSIDEDIKRLKKWDIEEVFIKDSDANAYGYQTPEDFEKFARECLVYKNIYFNILEKVKTSLGDFRYNNIVNISNLKSIIDSILDLINKNMNAAIELLNIENLSRDDYYYIRSLNVSMISLMLGKVMKFPEDKLQKLGLGAILYDIGLIRIQDKVLNKHEQFTPEEYIEIKKHTVFGYKIIKTNFRLEEEITVIPLEHHEHYNGKGYPRGISGNQIHLYPKIVAVAHSLEKILKPIRILRDSKRTPTYAKIVNGVKTVENKTLSDAVREIIKGANIKFDPIIAKLVVGTFSVYPVGTVVVLNDNRKGLVFATNISYPIRPIIKIVSDENDNFIEDGEVINLIETNKLLISGVDKDSNILEEVKSRLLDKKENNDGN
ncbi:HD-GYP domain-containing protein [Brachyspira pilosicoli]|uniref:HD-GYP domain-containing protein n=1 Tax=Brachyspira pilosicoli TaxID=52584 RepID=UPI0012F4C9DF|nr:HD domain-containing phosphohydrolase [Brachyspira pilosicoli]